MDQLIRTFLPLFIWHFQKIFGPVFTPNEWHAFALSFVPPPNNLANTIIEKYGDPKSSALLSPSARRRIRNKAKSTLRRQLRDDPHLLPVRHILCKLRQELEERGYQGDPGHTFKWRDIEADINSRWEQTIGNNDFPEELRSIAEKYPDAPNFLWELALGRGETKQKLHRKSALFTILGLDYERLVIGDPEDLLLLVFSALGVLDGAAPNEAKVARLLRWFVRNLLPPESEPKTTPQALNMAIQAGLIHKPIVIRDNETGEVPKIDIEDKSASQFGDPSEVKKLSPEETFEFLKREGINKDDLSEKDWQLIFRLNDAFHAGFEIGSKKGISLHAHFGDDSDKNRQQLLRLRKKITRIQSKNKE